MFKYLILLIFMSWNILGYVKRLQISECPVENPKNIIMIIDACYASNATYITYIDKTPCPEGYKGHAYSVIDTYKNAGGKKKVWLISFANNSSSYLFDIPLSIAINCEIKVISFSGGSYGSVWGAEKLKIEFFRKLGGVYLAAAGNDNTNLDDRPFYPASYKKVYAIGATTCKGNKVFFNLNNKKPAYKAKFSNYGSEVKIWACGESYDGKNYGTSFAVPRVAAWLENRKKKKK